MNTWRQIHNDGSQSVISSSGNFWQARLLHADGNSTQVGLLSSGVEEAKLMCELAWEYEHSHVCTTKCRSWELCSDEMLTLRRKAHG